MNEDTREKALLYLGKQMLTPLQEKHPHHCFFFRKDAEIWGGILDEFIRNYTKQGVISGGLIVTGKGAVVFMQHFWHQ